MRVAAVSVVGVALATCALSAFAEDIRQATKMPDILRRKADLSAQNLTSAHALAAVLTATAVPGGAIIVQDGCEPDQSHTVALSSGSLQNLLEGIVKADPRYRWHAEDGVVNLVPATGLPSLLYVRIVDYDSKEATNLTWATSLLLQLPEVRLAETELRFHETPNRVQLGMSSASRSNSGPRQVSSPLSVHLKNVTLREALNALVHANGHGVWLYREWNCNGKKGFDLSFSE